ATVPPRRRIDPVLLAPLVAIGALLGGWALWRGCGGTLAGQRVDHAAYAGAGRGQTRLWQVAERVLDVVSVGFVLGVLVAAMLIAVLRRRWGLAVQVAVLMAGANPTTRGLTVAVRDR